MSQYSTDDEAKDIKERKTPLIDRWIGAVSPQWAYNRAAWRIALQRGYYDAGSFGRLNSNWSSADATAEQTDYPQRDTIRARARDLERNSDIAESVIGALERNVVGTGIKVQAKVANKDGTDNDDLNKQIEDLWDEWCRPRNCDVTGQQSFAEMQAMAVRRLEVDGAIMFIKAYTNVGPVPFSLQAREIDELDTSIDYLPGLEKGNRVWRGVEMNEYNKPVAYWLKIFTPDGFWTGKSERIEARRVIFLWKKTRPTQIREISPLARTMQRIRDVNEFVEAQSVKERILACLAVFITKQTPGGIGRGTNIDKDSGYQKKTLSPGMIQELQPGETVNTVNPSGQSSNAKDFISTQQRLAGAGQGLSYEAVSRDLSQVNYSSARQGLLEDQRTYGMWQQFLIEHFCREVYTEFLISAVLNGQLKIPDFWQDKRRYLKHKWISPGWSWVDPLKEVKANSEALSTGQETLENLCAGRGEDWREILQQRAREMELAKSLGLDITGGDNKNVQQGQTEDGNATAENN